MNKDESIVRPKPISGFKKKKVVYLPIDSPSGSLKRAVQRESSRKHKDPTGELYLLPDRVVVMEAMGAPNAVLVLERLIAGGAEEIMILGYCGSLNPRARLMDALFVTEAYSDEGTSRHYSPENTCFHPSSNLSDEVERGLQKAGLAYLCGAVVSTDAPYRETTTWLEANLHRGVDVVDMETSAIFALSENRGVQAASLLLVSDELRRDGHVKGYLHPKLEERLAEYFHPFLLPGNK